MKLEQHPMGLWHATGKGPLRKIICEGGTRQEARYHYMDVYREQHEEFHKLYSAVIISATGIALR